MARTKNWLKEKNNNKKKKKNKKTDKNNMSPFREGET